MRTPLHRGPTFSQDEDMLWMIAMVLLIAWILFYFFVGVTSFLIHGLLLVAVIVIIYRLITGRPVA